QSIQLYRLEDDPAYQQQVEGFIQADAEADLGGQQVVESGWFRYLQEGVDYFVHPSGLWIGLRTPLGREEMLAVTYVTAVGDTIGDYNPERIYNAGGRPTLQLLKASGANHQPGRPTWDLEMHQIYRVSASTDVEQGSVDLTVSLGELSAGRTFKRRPSGEDITFLRLFGLDEEAPTDAVDPAFVYSPAAEFFADDSPVQGTFIVFPTLHPFAEPPPIPSLSLTEVEASQILGDDANRDIYDEEDPFERENAGRFRLTLAYRLRSEGLISSFSLGAFGIRDGSERIFLGDRILMRGTDYEIDYDVGQVRLLEPELLFASSPDASVRATWEQRSLFQVSPTQVFGLRTHTALGQNGGIDVLGLYQSERSVVTRPVLGTEPGAALLGGVSGSFTTELGWMNGLLDRVPGLEYDGQSTLAVNGELAVSVPNPNTRDRAFVDDFDAASQLPVSLQATRWTLGSAPAFRDGAETLLPAQLDATTVAPLVWQDSWIVQSVSGDSVGVHEGYFPRADIDNQIRVAGAEAREAGLRLTFGPNPGQPVSWGSMTTTLSTNGLDLTKTEFLEFYVAGTSAVSLMVDLGTASEDAFFVDDDGNTTGPRQGGGQWGLGLLDQEADPRRGEIWNDEADARGVWGESCLAERGRIYPLGDPRANCTRGNGRPDSEDLDQDGNLDTLERYLRYVVRLDGSSPYLERRTSETGTPFQLYRIPIRGAAGLAVGGPISEADLRAVRHLRVTVMGPTGTVELARMRLVGSRWIKRSGEGVLTSMAGDTLSGAGRVEVSTVSRVTEGDAYSSPPGVLEELEDPTTAFAGQGIEFNEKSLGIAFEDVPPGARAEVYHRFPQRPRNFLSYGEARLWVVAREGDFGDGRPNQFFLKVGSDSENFYLYRAPLRPASGSSAVTAADWNPEIHVDFDRWFELRLTAETLLAEQGGAPAEAIQVWSNDSTYAVVLKDRGRAPNLAAVRELSMGVWNGGAVASSGEIWIDELRLGDPVRDPGLAGSMDVELNAAGVLTSRLTMTNRGAYFRQLRDDPTYQTDRTFNLSSTLAIDHWMPAEWGLEMPVTLELGRTSQAPRFLAASDLRADRLGNLRDTEERRTRVGASIRKTTRSANPVVSFVVDGLDANVAYTTSDGSTVTTEHDSDAFDAGMGWVREPEAAGVGIIPDFAKRFVRAILPGFLEDDIADAELRLTPERVSLGSTYHQQDSRIFRYESIIQLPGDSVAIPTRIPREYLQGVADVRLRPLTALTADLAVLTVRDLLPPEEAVNDAGVQDLIRDERGEAAGLDLGWETNRTVRTRLAFRPTILPWLRNDFDWSTVYQSERNANFVERTVSGADTTLVLERSARGQRDWSATVAVDPSRLALSIFGEPDAVGAPAVQSVMSAVRPVSVTYQEGVSSRFNRDPIDPGAGYQFGWVDADAFRIQGADTAATITDRNAWRLGSGLTLPGGGGVQVGYQSSEAVTLDPRSGRVTKLKSWPEVQASLPTIPMPGFTGIRALNISSGIVRSVRTIEFGGAAAQRRLDDDVRIPVDVSIQWLRNLVTSYQGAVRIGRGDDPTGETERDERTHRVSIRTQLLPPSWLASRLDRPVSLSVLGAFTSQRTCRSTTASSECVAYLDQIGRTLNVSLDTSVQGFAVGLQVSFDDRQSFVGQRTGSTQFQIGLFGQLNFTGGSLPLS
ncbi:MAG: cell surface protein SprA, partial [Gemmatimonadota bacterium]